VYEGVKKLWGVRVVKLEIEEFVFYGKGKRTIPSVGELVGGWQRVERIWLNVSKALNDEDLIRFLTVCRTRQSLECLYLESSTMKFKKGSIERIQEQIRLMRKVILDIRLQEAGYPNLKSWLN
jgi:hypothetical protein